MTAKRLRVIPWLAVSTPEQAKEEKESLPRQYSDILEDPIFKDAVFVDTIRIPGHSRSYSNFDRFVLGCLKEGILDPERMYDHFEKQDFDVLAVRDSTRLGREWGIFGELVQLIIDSGALIYVQHGWGWVNENNVDPFIMSNGFAAKKQVRDLKKYHEMGMKARADRGLTTSSVTPMLYRADENGKLYPDRERYQRLFDDLAELFLAGTPYEYFPDALAMRGHLNPVTGKRFERGFVRRFLHTARTWGHAEYNRRALKRGSSPYHAELWACGRGKPPADVHFTMNVSEPVWAGALGEDIKDEMERRFYAIRGGARPFNTYPFSSLCVCGDCGATMIVQTKQKPNALYEYIVCKNGRSQKNGCQNYHAVRFEKIREYLDVAIQNWLSNPATHIPEARRQPDRLAAIDKEVSRLTARLDALIDLISSAPLSARADYQAKIDALASQRDTLHTERARVENAQREQEYTTRSRLAALESLRSVNLWTQPVPAQNQILRKILGDTRVVCEDGEVVELRVVS